MRSVLRKPSRGEWIFVLFLVTLIGLLGSYRPFAPLDWIQQSLSAQINAKPYQGNATIIAIDEETLSSRPDGEWNRADLARLLTLVGNAGAEQIIVDRQHFGTSRVGGESELATALDGLDTKAIWHIAISPDDVVNLSRFSDAVDAHAWAQTSVKLETAARGRVTPAVMTFQPYPTGAPVYAPLAISTREGVFPSLALLMAGSVPPSGTNTFPIDVSYDPNSITSISASKILAEQYDLSSLRGRQVLIGSTDNLGRDTFTTPQDIYTTRAAATVLAAQTLVDGPPIMAGWLPAFVIAGLAAFAWILLRKPYGRWVAVITGVSIVVTPVLLEQVLIYQETSNGVGLLILVGIGRLWKRIRDAIRTYRNAAETKSRFLAQASHDLRQPIHAIGLLSDRLSGMDLTPAQAEIVSKISWSVDNASRMFRALLDIAAIENGTLQTDIDQVSVNELLAAIDNQSGLLAEQAGVDLRLVPSEAMIMTDRALMGTMLQNLVTNAIRYAPGRKVLVGTRKRGNKLSFYVVDNGRGISASELKHVKKEFYRSSSRAGLRSDNKGLGLAIVSRLSRMLELKFELKSAEGKGTVATIEGLTWASEGQIKPKAKAIRLPPLSGLRVILADDDHETLKSTARLLEQWGCDVDCYSHLPDQPVKCDILVSDFDFGNGETLAQRQTLIEEMQRAGTKLIVISGHHPEQIRASLRSHSGLILSKPLRAAQLRSALMAARVS